MSLQLNEIDVLVIGSGLAAVTTALHLPRSWRVVIVTKGEMTEANSDLAQGGIASAHLETSGDAHANDTWLASKMTAQVDRVRLLVEEGRRAIPELEQFGVKFDRDGSTYAVGREGAHGQHRIFHVGGDETGRHVMKTLRDRLPDNVEWLEHVLIDELLQQDGRVIGAAGFHKDARIRIQARAIVLATGGIGGLVDWTSNCRTVTGDGLVLAQAVGAKLSHLERIQFHPTLLSVDVPHLVTEALRGAGARLVDGSGRHVMAHHPLGSLAPRDDVARTLTRHDGPVYLDTSCVSEVARRFPRLAATCRTFRVPIDRIPVRPGLHFHMGGIEVDEDGRTSVRGLYAVGEVAEAGVHGVNRLASNSLLECWVFGKRVAGAIQLGTSDSVESKRVVYDLDEQTFHDYRERIGKWLTIAPDEVEIKHFLEDTQQLPLTKHVTRQLSEQTLQLQAARLLATAIMEEKTDEPSIITRATDAVSH